MDNDAFKDLVRSKVKGNKEIARETVEEAFLKKKKKRKRGGKRRRGGGSDISSSSSESESEADRKRHKNDQKNISNSIDLEKDHGGSEKKQLQQPRYRDRAKERREGKSHQDHPTESMLTSADGEDMSKYMGGDEEHRHLVKGLDVALARSVREQMKPDKQKDVDDSSEGKDQFHPVTTKAEAWKLLLELEEKQGTKTMLGQSMLHYLLKKCPSRQHRIQRSQLTFSYSANPQDLARSWEIPSEQNLAAAASMEEGSIPKASPLSMDLITRIKHVQQQKSIIKDTQLNKKAADERSSGNNSSQRPPKNVLAEDDSEKDNEEDKNGNDDSDEDIFDIVGE